MNDVCQIIQFPKPKSPDFVKLRAEEIKDLVKTITEVFEKGSHQLVIFLTKKDLIETAEAINLLESRVIVVPFQKKKKIIPPTSRYLKYKYPCHHVIVMTPKIFQNDKKWIDGLMKVNNVLVLGSME